MSIPFNGFVLTASEITFVEKCLIFCSSLFFGFAWIVFIFKSLDVEEKIVLMWSMLFHKSAGRTLVLDDIAWD